MYNIHSGRFTKYLKIVLNDKLIKIAADMNTTDIPLNIEVRLFDVE